MACEEILPGASGPRSLWDLSCEYCVRHPETFCTTDHDRDVYVLRQGVELPSRVCESLISRRRQIGHLDDKFMHIFADTGRTLIQNADVNGSHITVTALEHIMLQHPNKLDISGCKLLLHSDHIRSLIEKHGFNLELLFLGNIAPTVFGFKLPSASASSQWDYSDSEEEADVDLPSADDVSDFNSGPDDQEDAIKDNPLVVGNDGSWSSSCQQLFRHCPKVQAFSAHCLRGDLQRAAVLIRSCVEQYNLLRHLDLSLCHFDLTLLLELPQRRNLVALILHGFVFMGSGNVDRSIEFITRLPNLRVLDLSCCLESSACPRSRLNLRRNNNLACLLASLQHLKWLDISTAKLAHDQEDALEEEDLDPRSFFQCRVEEPLEFLGILGCIPSEVLKRVELPAKKITGNANLDQMLFALKTYVKKPQLLIILSTGLKSWLYTHSETDMTDTQATELCQGAIAAMKKNPFDSEVHHCACDLFGTLELLHGLDQLQFLKRDFISAVVDAMETNLDVEKIIRKSCSFLDRLDWRHDIGFVLPRLVPILVKLDGEKFSRDTHQTILRLIWGIASNTRVSQKVVMGQLGVIKVLLENSWKIAQSSIVSWGMVDEIWGALWSLTDETPENGKRVLDCNGVEYFLKIYKECGDVSKMMNVVGTLGNIAEADSLRPALLTAECVTAFIGLLRHPGKSYGTYEMFNGAVCALAHMLAENSTWPMEEPSRQEVAERVFECVCEWNIKQPRNVQYRSFAPLLRILQRSQDLAPVYYAVWEIHSMMRRRGKKYCKMFLREGGLSVVRHCGDRYPELERLVAGICEKCKKFKDKFGDVECCVAGSEPCVVQEYQSDEEYISSDSDSEFSSDDESSMDDSDLFPDSDSELVTSPDTSDYDDLVNDDNDDAFNAGSDNDDGDPNVHEVY